MSAVQKPTSSPNVWIHCNRCFENYSQKQRILFLLSCYDVICEKCVIKENQTQLKCPLCGKVGGSYSISNNLPSKVKELFHPKVWTLNFPNTWSAVKFQTKQRDHFLLGCRKMSEFNAKLEEERNSAKEECREMYLLRQKTKKQKKQLEMFMKKFMEQQKKSQPTGIDLSHHERSGRDLSYRGRPELKAPRPVRSAGHRIHLSYNAPRKEDTFYFPPDDQTSKSFIL